MAFEYIPYNGPVVTRTDARAAGVKRFFTGKACRNEHLSERFVSTGQCAACISTWTVGPKGKAYHTTYRQENSARIVQRVAQWRIDNPEKAAILRDTEREPNKLRMQAWYREDPERARAQKREFYAQNPQQHVEWNSAWQEKNPEKVLSYKRNYRARKKNAEGSHTKEDVDSLFSSQKGRCAHPWCRVDLADGFHVDHIMPLVRGGSNDRRNLQLLCAPCNHSKNATHPIDYARRHGHLL